MEKLLICAAIVALFPIMLDEEGNKLYPFLTFLASVIALIFLGGYK